MKKNISKNLKDIPIFFASDDNYVPCLAVSIQSLIMYANQKNHYSIFVLNTGLNAENRKTLKDMETSNVKIKFVDVNGKIKSIKEKLEDTLRDYYSVSIFLRLFIPTLFPQYKKALYLDCDIAICDDIAKLYNTQLGDNLVGAINDQVVTGSEVFSYYVEHNSGVTADKYFNSGILVMNLEKFRTEKIEEKFIYILNHYNTSAVCPDQDILNILCKDRVTYVEKGWNKMSLPDENFDEKDLHLVHYNMYQKPWRYADVLFEKYFWDAAKQTKFYQTLLDMRDAYPEEKKVKDIEAGKKLLAYAKEVADDPTNFRKTLEREQIEAMKEKHLNINEDFNAVDNFLDAIFANHDKVTA